MKKIFLSATNLTAISLILLILPIASALDFNFSAPGQINIQEPFSVSIYSQTSESYDVKIYVVNSSNNILSESDNNGWKSSIYYIKNSFPKVSTYDIRAIKAQKDTEICVRMRKTGTEKTTPASCMPIIILNENSSNIQEANSEKEVAENPKNLSGTLKTDSNQENKPDNNNKNDIPEQEQTHAINEQQEKQISSIKSQPIKEDKIILNSRKKLQEEVFVTKSERFRISLIYAFTFFIVVILVFLAWRRL